MPIAERKVNEYDKVCTKIENVSEKIYMYGAYFNKISNFKLAFGKNIVFNTEQNDTTLVWYTQTVNILYV